MKVMLIEDSRSKRDAIKGFLVAGGVNDSDIICAANMTDFSANLHHDIHLFIVDFYIPVYDGGDASQNGRAIIEIINKSEKKDALVIAISSYPNDFPELRDYYEARGCVIVDYSKKNAWQSALEILIIQLKRNMRMDFLIFCALQEERSPYVALCQGKQQIRGGVDCWDVKIGERSGSVVLMPQMGLVNAAVVAGMCIDRYKPSVVGMSGICGGFSSRAKLGQLFVCSMAYEYQSGKWSGDGFKQEPYQCATDHLTLTKLRALVNQPGLIGELESGFTGARPSSMILPEVGIFTSGSAVIADKSHLISIEQIHRKVSALDMEVFALHRAAELSCVKPDCISAKTVVDLCDAEKGDHLHNYGSFISAKFLIRAIANYFEA